MQTAIIILIVFICLLALSGGGFFLYKKTSKKNGDANGDGDTNGNGGANGSGGNGADDESTTPETDLAWCQKNQEEYGVIVGETFGTLPETSQTKWTNIKCDTLLVPATNGTGVTCPVAPAGGAPWIYNKETKACETGYTNSCMEPCAKNTCDTSGGTWVPLDYSNNPYTCKV